MVYNILHSTTRCYSARRQKNDTEKCERRVQNTTQGLKCSIGLDRHSDSFGHFIQATGSSENASCVYHGYL